MGNKVRFGIVCVGNMGRLYLGTLSPIPGARVVALCSRQQVPTTGPWAFPSS